MTPQTRPEFAVDKARAIVAAIGDDLSNDACIIRCAIELVIEYLGEAPDEDEFIDKSLQDASEAAARLAGIVDAIKAYGLRHELRPSLGNSRHMMLGSEAEPLEETPRHE